MYFVLPGQGLVVQVIDSEFKPSQVLPPFCGAGLEHDRILHREPLPHVTLQPDQVPQTLHLPSTEIWTRKQRLSWKCSILKSVSPPKKNLK